jgi:hypothetical protein
MYQYGETVIISTKEVAPEPHRRPHDAAKKAVAQRPVETPCPLTPPIPTWQSLFSPMGYYGGLGGGSINCLRSLSFDEETESASFYANMGDTPYPGALAILIRLLENFSVGVLAIEAVALGTGLPKIEKSV